MVLRNELAVRESGAFFKVFGAILLLALSLGTLDCQAGTAVDRRSDDARRDEAPTFGYEVVKVYPHDPNAYTQGLIFRDGVLLESTGREGTSSLRRVELETGKVLNQVDVPAPYFAEGLAQLKDKLYQLTWQHQLCFVYDHQSFEKVGQLAYEGEGWGLTTDGSSLLLSDGSNRIKFLDPESFNVSRTLNVVDGKRAVKELNELEYIKGEIFANVWHQDRVAIIDATTGKVNGWVDLKGLLGPGEVSDGEAVLNGIAYDDATGRLFVTGKLWPKLFEIKIKR